MAMIYVAHKYEVDRKNIEKLGHILRKLQKENPQNSYFSPLHNFSYLDYNDLEYEDMMECCYDFLEMCDKMIVVGNISNGVSREIEMAERFINSDGKPMEVEYIDE